MNPMRFRTSGPTIFPRAFRIEMEKKGITRRMLSDKTGIRYAVIAHIMNDKQSRRMDRQEFKLIKEAIYGILPVPVKTAERATTEATI